MHQQNYKKAVEWTERLRGRYMFTLSALRIFDQFQKIAAPNIVGKKRAEANVRIINLHKNLLLPLKEAARVYFLVELAKFFDKHNKTLTIKRLLRFLEQNLSSFSKDEFVKYHPGILQPFIDHYKPITKSDIKRLRQRLQKNGPSISALRKYRNQFLAHDDLEKSEIKLNRKDIAALFRLIKAVLRLCHKKLLSATWIYDSYDKQPVLALDRVIESLQEHEALRLKRIQEEYLS
jgi:hypothetical protein